MFDDVDERAQAVAVPLLYGVVEAVVIGLYCVWAWKVGWTKAPPDEKICTVITKSYEIHREEDADEGNGEGEGEGSEELALEESKPSSDPDAGFTTPPAKDSRRRLTSDYTSETASTAPSPQTSQTAGDTYGEKLDL